MSDKFPGGLVTTGAPAGFSVAFNGTSDYLTVPTSANLTLGTGDFTFEAWIYPLNWTNSRATVARGSGATNSPIFAKFDSSNNLGIAQEGVAWIISDATLPSVNTWTHVAWTRSGTTFKIYVNGVQSGSTGTSSANFSAPILNIGASDNSTANGFFTGYISNVRVIKGTAIYTTTFTPPTQLFPITNTQLLTCQSPTLIDNSSNAFVVTAGSTAKVSNFTPFPAYTGFNPALGAAAPGVWTLDEAAYYQNNRKWPIYDPYFNQTTLMLHGNGTNGTQNNTFLDSSTNNFSITRNGNTTQGTFTPFSQTGWGVYNTASSYCQLNNADYSLSTGDFTVEFWMYCVDDTSYSTTTFASATSNPNFTVALTGGSSNAKLPYLEYGGSGTTFAALSGYLNKWTHIAFVRTSGNIVVYQNGVATGSPVSKSAAVGSTASLFLLHNSGDASADFRGYISNFRITKSAVYSSNFTPSTQPLTALSNTVLLAFQDNRFRDNSANNSTVTPAGTASVQAFSPFVPAYITPTTYSNYFNGSTGYLTSTATAIGSGNFTIECWVYITSISADRNFIQMDVASTSTNVSLSINGSGNTARFLIRNDAATTNLDISSSVALSANTWYHIAGVANSTTGTLYVNGSSTAGATGTITGTRSGTGTQLRVGVNTDNASRFMIGCISNARIVVGTAVYTTSFTPPIAPLTAISGTSLLTCQSSTFKDNSSNNFTITATGVVQPVTSPTPFPANVDQTTLNSAYSTSLIGGSGYFDGSGDYLQVATPTTALQLAANNFTFETWAYFTSVSGNQILVSYGFEAGTNKSFIIYYTASTLHFDWATTGSSSTSNSLGAFTPVVGQWYHIAVVRNSTTVTGYVNGVALNAPYTIGAGTVFYPGTSGAFKIGNDSTNYFFGYMLGTRLVNGTALYTSSFAPPIAPPTPVANTSLLLNYTNAGIYDNTAKNVLETVGNAQISTAQSKWGSSSMYFNNTLSGSPTTTDYLSRPSSQLFNLGSGNFTVEFWFYPSTISISNPNNQSFLVARADYGANTGWSIYQQNQLIAFRIGNSGGTISTGNVITATTWQHIAVVRSGSTISIYVNGTSQGSGTNSSFTDASTILNIGGIKSSTGWNGDYPFNGYIDDLRITQGVARYTTNFTPPTSQLQDQ